MLLRLLDKAQNTHQLVRALAGRGATPLHLRKLVATIATLIARRFVIRTKSGSFRLTETGRSAVLEKRARPPAEASTKRRPKRTQSASAHSRVRKGTTTI